MSVMRWAPAAGPPRRAPAVRGGRGPARGPRLREGTDDPVCAGRGQVVGGAWQRGGGSWPPPERVRGAGTVHPVPLVLPGAVRSVRGDLPQPSAGGVSRPKAAGVPPRITKAFVRAVAVASARLGARAASPSTASRTQRRTVATPMPNPAADRT